jgi:hypothetical protein
MRPSPTRLHPSLLAEKVAGSNIMRKEKPPPSHSLPSNQTICTSVWWWHYAEECTPSINEKLNYNSVISLSFSLSFCLCVWSCLTGECAVSPITGQRFHRQAVQCETTPRLWNIKWETIKGLVTKRCRLSCLTNRRLCIWAQMRSCGVSANEFSCTQGSPNKLWRYISIFNLRVNPVRKSRDGWGEIKR